jgi:hypothetical protein
MEEEMSRKNASRGIFALILVLGLTLAGASPAAAADFGSWNFSFDGMVSGFWAEVTRWLGSTDKASEQTDRMDRGFGLDPNGNSVSIVPDDPQPVGPQG